jgi:hypothetical protein
MRTAIVLWLLGGTSKACAIPGKEGLEDIRAGFAELIELENSLEWRNKGPGVFSRALSQPVDLAL